MSVEEKRSTPAAFIRYVRQIRSQIIATGALILALVSQADATAEHDYKPGEFLIVDGGTSPDKKFSIVAGDNKAGEFGVYLRDAHTKKLIGQLKKWQPLWTLRLTPTTPTGLRTRNMSASPLVRTGI